MKIFLLICSLLVAGTVATAASVEKIKNDRVVAQEISLQAGETEPAGGGGPSLTVFLTDAYLLKVTADKSVTSRVARGGTFFREATGPKITAAATPVRFVRIEFPGSGDDFVWGTKGFAPDYKLLLENRFARIYDIRIAALASEPQHTHRDRVVVCLSGAKLRHVLPDGHEEDSSIATGDCLWRKGQTHVGKNIGDTPLWVIALEPK